MKSDIEIARSVELRPIVEIAGGTRIVTGHDRGIREPDGQGPPRRSWTGAARRDDSCSLPESAPLRRARASRPSRWAWRRRSIDAASGPSCASASLPWVPCMGIKGGAAGGVVPGPAHGGDQSPLHRRHPRRRCGDQPARGSHRQPPPPRQRAGHRSPSDPLEARRRYERPVPAEDRGRSRRQGAGSAARGRLPDHGRQRSDGHPVSRGGNRGPRAAARGHRHRLDLWRRAGARAISRPRAR